MSKILAAALCTLRLILLWDAYQCGSGDVVVRTVAPTCRAVAGRRTVGQVQREQIYEALFDDEAFGRLPALLAKAANAKSCMLHWRHREGPFEILAYSHFTPEIVSAYAQHWATHDLWVSAGLNTRRLNTLWLLEEAVSQNAFARSTIYNEFLRKEADDTFHCVGGIFSDSWGDGLIGIHRGRKARPFDEEDLRRLRPHTRAIGHVLKIKGQLAAAQRRESRATGALDTLALAVCTIDARGRVLSSNAAAEMVFRRDDGLCVRNGVITAQTQADAIPLQSAIAQATARNSPSAASTCVQRPIGAPPYLITVTPLVNNAAGCGMIVFRDPDAEDMSLVQRLRAWFGLTSAEAEIAVGLGAGQSAAEIAVARGVSANTMSWQLKCIMAKMNCNRQAEIAAVVAGLPNIRQE